MKTVAKPEMSPEKFSQWMTTLGFDTEAAAAALDMTPQQINNFRSGRAPIRRVVMLACQMIAFRALNNSYQQSKELVRDKESRDKKEA